MLRLLAITAWLALGAGAPAPGPTRIILDGEVDDWTVAADAIVVTNDEKRLLIRIELDRELQIQESNRLEMYLDADGDPATGCRPLDLGADLIWRFGKRQGVFCSDGRQVGVRHHEIGLITTPTVTSKRFEIALDRAARPAGEPLFPGRRVTVRFSGEGASRDPIGHEFRDLPLPAVEPLSFGRPDPASLRVLSHNLNGRLLKSPAPVFARVYSAIAADIHLFQEIRGTSPGRVEELLRAWVPQLAERPLHTAAAGLDGSRGRDTNVLVSPFPILASRHLGGSGVYLLELDAETESRLLVVVLSLPCCNDHAGRDRQIDQIHALLREAKAGGGEMALAPETPILLMGDANLVGPASQLTRLLDGTTAGPDWDGTAFRDAMPRHLFAPLTFTWYGIEPAGYSPGRLDYVIYSDSVLEIANAFVLHTPEMSVGELDELGLEAGDTSVLSHHLPVVVDITSTTGR